MNKESNNHQIKESERPTILAIDFDGTIVEHDFPRIGKLKNNAKEVINRLYDEGFYIIIWSCRGGIDLNRAYSFLRKVGIKFHGFNTNIDMERIGFCPFPKVYADIYIDDRNLGGLPEDWNDIYSMIVN